MPVNMWLDHIIIRVINKIGQRLSNSGDLLKITLLNYFLTKFYKFNRKICGWSNDSGIVTTCNIHENGMEYRGSKSGIINTCKRATSRRQSFTILPVLHYSNINSELRYTLTAFERKYHNNVQSKFQLNPWFITGLADAEGSFILKIGLREQLDFSLILHSIDKDLVLQIHQYFGIGNFRIKEDPSCGGRRRRSPQAKINKFRCEFSVVKIKDIIEHVIPHFDKYPLQTKKRVDYLLFKQAAFIKYYEKKKYNVEQLISIRASMNKGLTPTLKAKYPNIIPVLKPEIKFNKDLNPYWISGFVSGDGHFSFKIDNNNRVRFFFIITQNIRDIELLNHFINYFNCGFTYINKKDNCCYFEVNKYSDIVEKVIPFFDKYNLNGIKLVNYNYFKEGFKIFKFKESLSSDELIQMKNIQNNMNSKGLAKYILNISAKD